MVGRQLYILALRPPDKALKARLETRLALEVVPRLALEVRLYYAMHKLYGSALLPRYQALLIRLDGSIAPSHHAHAHSSRAQPLSWGVSSSRVATPRGKSGGALSKQDVRTLVARLAEAPDRDSLVEVLLGFALTVFDFVGLFLVQNDYVHGWRGTHLPDTLRIAQVSLPLSLPSVFQTVFATGGHYLGPLPANTANTNLLAALGRESPRVALVAPIRVGDRLVAMMYADKAERAVPLRRVAAMLVLIQRTGLGLQRLIEERKRPSKSPSPWAEALRPEPPPGPTAASALAPQDSPNSPDAVLETLEQSNTGPTQTRTVLEQLAAVDSLEAIHAQLNAELEALSPGAGATAAPPAPTATATHLTQRTNFDAKAPQHTAQQAATLSAPLEAWEDVLLDTAREAEQSSQTHSAQHPADLPPSRGAQAFSVGWAEVAEEARKARLWGQERPAQQPCGPWPTHWHRGALV